MIRSLSSTDLLKLSFSELRKLPNHAKPRNRVGSANLSIRELLPIQYWLSVSGQRHTWVDAQRLQITGLVSARSRRGASAWEIDQLAFLPGSFQEEMNVLHGLALGAGRKGVDRLFLRLSADCSYTSDLRSIGFDFYGQERLYAYENPDRGRGNRVSLSSLGLEAESPADEFGVFQLFNAAYPPHVREAEGQTLNDWSDVHHSWAGPSSRGYVHRQNGTLAGWLRTSGGKGRGYLQVVSKPEFAIEEHLVEAGLALLKGASSVYCQASDYQAPLGNVLEDKGFKPVEEYTAAVRHITARIRRPSLVPIGVK